MGRTTLVVRGSRGIISRATSDWLAKDGHRVAVTYRGSFPAPEHLTVQGDLRYKETFDEVFATVERELGAGEIAVVNAGLSRDRLSASRGEGRPHRSRGRKSTRCFPCSERASKGMLRLRWERLIFVSSAVASSGERGHANYVALKARLVGFARSLSRELGSRNVVATVVAPGCRRTDITASLTDKQRDHMFSQILVGWLAQPNAIAVAVSFLASHRASYIDGAVLSVDGGAGMRH